MLPMLVCDFVMSKTSSPSKLFDYDCVTLYRKYSMLTESKLYWKKVEYVDGQYNMLTKSTLCWKKLQCVDRKYNMLTESTLYWKEVEYVDGQYNMSTTSTLKEITMCWQKVN